MVWLKLDICIQQMELAIWAVLRERICQQELYCKVRLSFLLIQSWELIYLRFLVLDVVIFLIQM
ncbi:hypothetical protein B7988_04985 [Fibrobacter sp. UWB1]|nr:hypothetical protein B7988_04985 [Fibrobacter sp. UWB1]